MSVDIGYIRESGSRGVELRLCRYFGGEKAGACMQLTAIQEDGQYGYVQITAADAIALIPHMKALIDDALSTKRQEAIRAIEENKELERTIVKDMVAVAEMAMAQPVLDMAALLTLGQKVVEK